MEHSQEEMKIQLLEASRKQVEMNNANRDDMRAQFKLYHEKMIKEI